MQELTPENAGQYLRDCGWIAEGPVRAEPLGWGVSNLVLRIVTPGQSFVLKQSRPRLRTIDPWFSDLERVYREEEVMRALCPLLPQPTVPRVLFSDRANYVFAMTEAPAASRVWKEVLLSGDVDLAVAERAGSILGRIHEATARDPAIVRPFHDRAVFIQLRVDPFYRKVQERRPEVAREVGTIADRMLSRQDALCHGDYSPKNILVHDRGFTLVDYETAHWGDPTMDLGFFLSHLILKAARRSPLREKFFELTRAFWRAYLDAVQFCPPNELVSRAIEHFGVCALARIDGTSPVDYLTEESNREAVRALARWALRERPARWEDVLQHSESQFSTLAAGES
jgi:5-methylthioribose kinase